MCCILVVFAPFIECFTRTSILGKVLVKSFNVFIFNFLQGISLVPVASKVRYHIPFLYVVPGLCNSRKWKTEIRQDLIIF